MCQSIILISDENIEWTSTDRTKTENWLKDYLSLTTLYRIQEICAKQTLVDDGFKQFRKAPHFKHMSWNCKPFHHEQKFNWCSLKQRSLRLIHPEHHFDRASQNKNNVPTRNSNLFGQFLCVFFPVNFGNSHAFNILNPARSEQQQFGGRRKMKIWIQVSLKM